ncbi:hypothetical protein D3C81_2282030 [compost metagenome]
MGLHSDLRPCKIGVPFLPDRLEKLRLLAVHMIAEAENIGLVGLLGFFQRLPDIRLNGFFR